MIEAVKRLRLFLEGIECPVISANVTCNIGSSATASIAVIATPEMLNLSTRTCVHLFFLEDVAVTLESDFKDNSDLASDKRYRLLFMGELHSLSYTKNASGGINGLLECKDHYENYNRAYVYFSTLGDINANGTEASNTRYIYSGALVQNNYISFNAQETLTEAFRNPTPLTAGYQDSTGMLASIIHLIERFTGFITPDKKVEIMGYSTFQTLQQLRLRILQQIGIYSTDTFASKLMESSFLISMIQNTFKIEGGLLTVSQIIDEILNVIYYARVSNTCGYGVEISDSQKVANSSRMEVIEYLLTITTAGVTDFIAPSTYDLAQDKAVFPITWFGLSQDAYQRVVDSKDIRVWKDTLNKPFSSPNPHAQMTLQTLINKLESNGSDKEVQARLEQISELLRTVNNRTLVYTELIDKVFLASGSVYYKMYQEVPDDTKPQQIEGGKLLKTTMLIPDLFWSVAPTCNVIFPNMYESFSLNSQLTEQTTRLTLQTTNEFIKNSKVPTKYYFSPSLIPVRDVFADGVATKTEVVQFIAATERGKRFDGFLLDHELFSGIVPEFATKDIFKFLVAGLDKQGDNGQDFLERTTDYLYVQSRLSKTSISINGIFNPYVAVGFPCVVFDRYSTTDTGSEFLGNVSNHYIGLVSLVSHSIDQSSANTSYSISYARRHKDDSIKLGGAKLGSDQEGPNEPLEPLETRIEPLWLDRAYRSDRIGEQVYKELLGVKSIVDDTSIEKLYTKFEDGALYASQESAIENLEKKILSTKMSSNGSVGKFTRSYIYREIATLDFIFGQNPFHSFDIDIETTRQTFNVCPVNFSAPISNTPHSSDAPKSSAVNIEEIRKDLVRKYVESIHNRGIPL
jgi:hypothetical protein